MNKHRVRAADAATLGIPTAFACHALARAVRDSIRQTVSPWSGARNFGPSGRGAVIDSRVLASAGLGLALSVNTGAHATPIELARPEIGASRQELVIIDAHVPSVETLEQALRPGLEAVVLDPDRDGVEQIADILAEYSHVEALHLVSHGEPGRLQLGNIWLSTDTVGGYRETLANWFPTQGRERWNPPDLLIYGCEVGAGASGSSFLDTLSAMTGADVAASADRTGASGQNGDWVFEVTSPAMRTPLAFDRHVLVNYPHILATFSVTNLIDAGPGSLRAAIDAANGNPGSDEIVFEGSATEGTLQLESTLVIRGDDSIDDMAPELTITGPGADRLTIRGGEFSIFHFRPIPPRYELIEAAISGITVTGARGYSGYDPNAAFRTDYGKFDLRDTIITGNDLGVYLQSDFGFGSGFASIENSRISGNVEAIYLGEYAGATIRNSLVTQNSGVIVGDRGFFSADRSTISGNGGGVDSETLRLNHSTVSGNNGGIDATFLTIKDSTIFNNGSGISVSKNPFLEGPCVDIRNSTITRSEGIGLYSDYAANEYCLTGLSLENTIISGHDQDCAGPIDSLGHNIIGDPNGCDITLQSSDLTGDPGLGEYVDPGSPGQGRVPLLASSPAIDSGNNTTCSDTDQLDTPRADGSGDGTVVCDRGAVEFYPLVEDRVTLEQVKSRLNPASKPGAPGGTVTLKATFTNSLDTTLYNPFFEVTKAKRSPVLLNAEGAPGQVGARLRPKVGRDQAVGPGESFTAVFKIGLKTAEPFRFDVGLHGDPRP